MKRRSKRRRLMNGILHIAMAVVMGVALLAGQIDLFVNAQEEPAVYEASAEQEISDGEKEQESSEETDQPSKEHEGEKGEGEMPGEPEKPEGESEDISNIEEEEIKAGDENTDEEAGKIQDAVTVEEENAELTSEQAEPVTLAESVEVDAKELEEGDIFDEGLLRYTVIDADNRYVAVSSRTRPQYEHELVIPEKVIYEEREYTVTEISSAGFAAYKSLTGIDIPDSVEKIGRQAFFRCSKLAWVSMKEGLTTLGLRAFEECESLKEVDMPDSVTTIESSVFAWCTSLEKVKLSSNLSGICEGLFYQCHNLKEITFPCGLTSIGTQMFSGCLALTAVTLPSSVIEIGQSAFQHCENMSELGIAVTVTEEDGQKKVSPIKINYGIYNPPFVYCLENRDLVFMTEDGKTPLTGSDLAAAIDAYDKVTDHDEEDGDGKWYGWNLPKVEYYTISAFDGEHGRIAPSGSVTVAGGDNQIFTMTPDEGYRIKSVIVDRSEVTWEEAVQVFADEDTVQTGKAGTYTFPNVQADHTIEVSFEKVGGGTTGEENPPKGDNDPENPGNDRPIGGTTGSDNPGGGNSGSTDSGNGSTANGDNAEASAVDVIVTVVDSSAQAAPAVMTETETSAAQNGGNRVTADNAAAPKGTQSKEPKTGDSPHLEIYATFAMIAGLTYMLLYFMEEGRGMTEREKDVFVAAFIRWAKKGGSFRKCCALVAIFCILAYYHSVGRCGKEKLYPVLH